MELAEYRINYSSRRDKIVLYPLGDIHFGTRHCDVNLLNKTIAKIRDNPNAYWIGMGDYCEMITLSDPRFVASEILPDLYPSLGTLAVAQRDAIIELLKPIADKCLGLLEGNHEYEIKNRHYVDIVRDMARELRVCYLGNAAMIRLVVYREPGNQTSTFYVYAEHGSGGGKKPGGKINALEDMMSNFDADIYLRGHVHTKLSSKRPMLKLSSKGKLKLMTATRVCVLTGCYYRSYEVGTSSYAERRGFPPTELGTPAVLITPTTREIEVTT